MTFTTLQIGAVEMALGDWGIDSAFRTCANQGGDNFTADMITPADGADNIPFGTLAILRINRVSSTVNTLNPSMPPTGATGFSGGSVFWCGWRVENIRNGSMAEDKFAYKFAGVWEYWLERIRFKKKFITYNGVSAIVGWRGQIVLGESLTPLFGPGDTVTGSITTNLMSIRQQLIEIVQYAIAISALKNGGASYGVGGTAQFQFDDLTADVDGVNYDLLDQPIEEMIINGLGCLIPDYLPNMGGNPGSPQTNVSANINTVLRARLSAVNNITCAEALRTVCKDLGVGDAVVWFDYSTCAFDGSGNMTAGPAMKISTRDQLPPVTLAWPPADGSQNNPQNPYIGPNGNLYWSLGGKVKARNDLVPEAVAMQYRILGSGQPQVVSDIATISGDTITEGIGLEGLFQSPAQFLTGANPATTNLGGTVIGQLTDAALLPNVEGDTVDMEGGQSISATISCTAVNLDDPASDSTAIPFYNLVWPELAAVTGLKLYDASGSPATVTDSNGNPVDLGIYQYRLNDGQIAPWMSGTGGAGQTIQATVSAKLAYVETASDGSSSKPSKTAPYHLKIAPITLTNLPSGTYGETVAGEQVPYGLSGFLIAIWSILQFEGTFDFQEIEISDQCPLGNNLCISGGAAEWAAMNGCVQSVRYNLLDGITSLTIGPAGHLDAKDFIARSRANRGDRWLYSIGGNLTNASGGNGALGNNIPKSGASAGNAVTSIAFHPSNIADWLGNTYSNGAPGTTFDANPPGVTQPTYGTPTTPRANAPLTFHAVGSGGTLDSFGRLDGAGNLILAYIDAEEPAKNITVQSLMSDFPESFPPGGAGVGVCKWRELALCNPITGATFFVQAWMSGGYATSLGNAPTAPS